jgi:cytochrome c
MYEFKDPEGKYYIKDFITTARKGHGWVAYQFVNPVTKKTEPKSTYVESAGDIIIGCGIYH